MKILALSLVFFALSSAAIQAQDLSEQPEGFTFIIGPRVGYSYTFTSQTEFSKLVTEVYPAGDYSPSTTIFGLSMEQRIILGETKSHFAFQEVFTVHGLEQSIALPVMAGLIGYRDATGLEAGVGPMLSANGLSVLIALGYTISYRGVFVPIDFSFTVPNSKSPTTIGLTTGFNFVVQKKKMPKD